MKTSKFITFTFIISCLLLIGCGKITSSDQSSFDGNKSFSLLKQQVDFGPRIPGSEASIKCAAFMKNELAKYAAKVREVKFLYSYKNKDIQMRNIMGIINPNSKRTILLCAHWDSRPFADQEVDIDKMSKPIPGANDGASGVAVLLELARVLSAKDPNCSVLIVFFDGEDFGRIPDEMFLGAKHFAKNIGQYTNKKIDFGILVDMVGDKNLNIPKEEYSVKYAPDIVDLVWNTAAKMGYDSYFNKSLGYEISDDHLQLNKEGIKCIDIIDFDYGPWHTLDDTIDKCSPKSLEVVGKVIEQVVRDY